MKKILYIDMDGVIVDFKSVKINAKDLKEFGSEDNIPGLYGKMIPMQGAIDAVKLLNVHYQIYILSTAPWGNPSAWTDKLRWIKKYLPEIGYKRLILSHNKHLNVGDYLIDDRPDKNGAGEFTGKLLHFGENGEYKNWQDILDYLLKEENINYTEYVRNYNEYVVKTWELLPENIKENNTINKLDNVIDNISKRININRFDHRNENLTLDIMLDYVEAELSVYNDEYETEFVEEAIKAYDKYDKFLED